MFISRKHRRQNNHKLEWEASVRLKATEENREQFVMNTEIGWSQWIHYWMQFRFPFFLNQYKKIHYFFSIIQDRVTQRMTQVYQSIHTMQYSDSVHPAMDLSIMDHSNYFKPKYTQKRVKNEFSHCGMDVLEELGSDHFNDLDYSSISEIILFEEVLHRRFLYKVAALLIVSGMICFMSSVSFGLAVMGSAFIVIGLMTTATAINSDSKHNIEGMLLQAQSIGSDQKKPIPMTREPDEKKKEENCSSLFYLNQRSMNDSHNDSPPSRNHL